jgi:hypothetical protein
MDIKTGDRVKCLAEFESNTHIINQKGKVLWVRDETMLIEFDSNVFGHDGNHDRVTGREGHCWWVKTDLLELLEREVKVIKQYGIVKFMRSI